MTTKGFVKKVIRRCSRSVTDYFWSCDQHLRRVRLKNLSASRLSEIRAELSKSLHKTVDGCVITISFGSRQLGNRDNLLDTFCRSFLKMTENPSLIEIIIKIDEDDDIVFFQQLYKRYQKKINLRFRLTERGRGYSDMHIWHTKAFEMRSPSSKVIFILSEDAVFCFKNWDQHLRASISSWPNDYFIGAPTPLEDIMKLYGPNPVRPVPVYWLGGVEYPITSVALLKSTEKIAKKYPDWTPYGNLLLIDSFSGDILKSLWLRHSVNWTMQLPAYAFRKGVFSWTDSEERNSVRTTNLVNFFNKHNQEIRNEMADQIYEDWRGAGRVAPQDFFRRLAQKELK